MKFESVYEYLSISVQNEVSVNDYYMRILGRESVKYSFPGASKLAAYRLDGWFMWLVLNLTWPFLLSPLVNLYFLIKSLAFKRGLMLVDGNAIPPVLSFVSGDTTRNVLDKAIGIDIARLYRPRQRDQMSRGFDVDCLQLLSFLDLLGIYFRSIFYSSRFSFDKRYSNNRLYSVFFFDLLVVCRAFEEIGSLDELYTGDHFDRWAVLLDLISSDKNNVASLSIVQHGGLKDASGLFPIDLPVRLSSVGCLYCFDEGSYSIFKGSVIAEGKFFSVVYFKNSITLSDVPKFDGVVILIVGNSLCYDFHVSIFKSMFSSSDKSLKVYYKPHPTQIMSHYESEGWEVIMQPEFFPKVDLVISYPSTLVDQYKEHGIPVLTHDISERFNNDCRVFHDVRSFLDSQK